MPWDPHLFYNSTPKINPYHFHLVVQHSVMVYPKIARPHTHVQILTSFFHPLTMKRSFMGCFWMEKVYVYSTIYLLKKNKIYKNIFVAYPVLNGTENYCLIRMQ